MRVKMRVDSAAEREGGERRYSFDEREKELYVPSPRRILRAFRARLGKETHRKQMELHTRRERRLIA